jgi:acyl-CoA thioester hydrolase
MHVYSHRVRYHEVDAQYVMFNARFLEVADVAVTELYRRLGWPYQQMVTAGFDPSVVRALVTYLEPVRFDDIVDVAVTCTKVGNASFDLAAALTRDGTTVATVELVYVNVDRATQRSTPVPPAIADALRSAMHAT